MCTYYLYCNVVWTFCVIKKTVVFQCVHSICLIDKWTYEEDEIWLVINLKWMNCLFQMKSILPLIFPQILTVPPFTSLFWLVIFVYTYSFFFFFLLLLKVIYPVQDLICYNWLKSPFDLASCDLASSFDAFGRFFKQRYVFAPYVCTYVNKVFDYLLVLCNIDICRMNAENFHSFSEVVAVKAKTTYNLHN